MSRPKNGESGDKNLQGEQDPDYDPDAEAEEADAMMEALLGDDEDE